MKIRTKLLFYFSFIAIVAITVSTFIAIKSVKDKLYYHQKNRIKEILEKTEKEFYYTLTDITRKAIFISDLKEIAENINKKDELSLLLEFKGFFFSGLNIKIFSKDYELLAEYINSPVTVIKTKRDLKKLPFFREGKNFEKSAGIFYENGRIIMVSTSPVLDPETYEFAGYVVIEKILGNEFGDYLKEKTGAEIVLYMLNGTPICSTLCGEEDRFVPEEKIFQRKKKEISINKHYFMYNFFYIKSFENKVLGKVYVLTNIDDIKELDKLSIRNLIIAAVLLYVVVILLSFFSGSKMTKPILKIVSASKKIAEGKYDIKIDIKTRDEIRELAESLEETARSLSQHEKELRSMKELFEGVIQFLPSAMIVCDVEGNIVSMNKFTREFFDIKNENLKFFALSKNLASIKDGFLFTLMSGEPKFYSNFPIEVKNGQKITNIVFYRVPYLETYYIVIHIEDVTERFRLEDKIIHYQKLGRMGEFLTKFTHDFKNLIAALEGHFSLLKRELQEGKGYEERISTIEKILRRTKNMGNDILSFTKKKESIIKKINVCSKIKEILSVLNTVLIGIEVEFKEDCEHFILGNEEKISLLFLNIIINAKDALSVVNREKKFIKIDIKEAYIERMAKSYIRIRVKDNGCGMEKELIDKIFDPYFTTKGEEGTGVGLSTVKEIIEEHEGFIEVESEKDKGTTFTVYIPSSKE